MNLLELKDKFGQVATELFATLQDGEELILNLHAEDTLFNRFSQSKLRQTTAVKQSPLVMTLNDGKKATTIELEFLGSKDNLLVAIDEMRETLTFLPDDPYLVSVKNEGESNSEICGTLLTQEDSFSEVLEVLKESDAVGIYTSGAQLNCLYNSKGTKHSFYTESFYLDYSLFSAEQKAVKDCFGATVWNGDFFKCRVAKKQEELERLSRSEKVLTPGKYRVYLAPRATAELVGMLGWYGVSYTDFKQGQSCLAALEKGEKQFAPTINISNDYSLGFFPRYNSLGQLRPENLDIIKRGQLANFLISSRAAQEYQVKGNLADIHESPDSLVMRAGDIAEDQILQQLGTGIYISDLWYLNWSDVASARITGMTRYACFWVEDGVLQGPIKHMRFDESLYSCLGDNLVGITDFQEVIPSTDSYDKRSFGATNFPGIICKDFSFTL
jgi:predicted Zn-dependent protease